MPTSLDAAALANLEELFGPDVSGLAELADSFGTTSGALVADMRAAVSDADAQLACRAAHTLKSSAALFGAMHLAELCRQLEAAAADEGDYRNAAKVAAIEAALADALVAIGQFVAQAGAAP